MWLTQVLSLISHRDPEYHQEWLLSAQSQVVTMSIVSGGPQLKINGDMVYGEE